MTCGAKRLRRSAPFEFFDSPENALLTLRCTIETNPNWKSKHNKMKPKKRHRKKIGIYEEGSAIATRVITTRGRSALGDKTKDKNKTSQGKKISSKHVSALFCVNVGLIWLDSGLMDYVQHLFGL